ncbi:Tryptophan synthase alpha chain [Patulibacter medicamentivorans]|uniref:Tryptophan synthase alpha chain n=1 Tax=Patulibacter medicamentivorans TaxID=1097667 RepID=H0EAI4_9ACTN|nr:tryptophan synthase subunit alpha [Patulibacter medicamentivorans]EHN09311.1 Tryptophan synthase alpha chain [Patulibacter medicamentivorans]
MSGAERLAAAIHGAPGRAALGTFVVGGFPTVELSGAAAAASAAAGAAFVEIGLPSRDPTADGPAIESAGRAALHRGASVDGILDAVAVVSAAVPVVVMCYASAVYARGPERFVAALRRAGACGLIVADLPVDAAREVQNACRRYGIGWVPIVAGSTPPGRLHAACATAGGFVYVAQAGGVTGERGAMPDSTAPTVARVREMTELPIAVGFGVSTREHVRAVADAGADGVIVGSRVVRAIQEHDDPVAAVAATTRDLVAGLAVAPAG